MFWHFDGLHHKSLPYYPPPNKRGNAINIATSRTTYKGLGKGS